ncbi:MAG: hypothetical protein ACRD93_03755 [Nitrososphaeraceae archaeon]
MPDLEIAQAVFEQTGKTITDRSLCTVRQLIKKESYHWYSQLREGQYEFLHEFKERINEIYFLQKKLYEIIDNNEGNPSIQLDAIAELHKLNITLSNYFDVAPAIGITLSTAPETKSKPGETRKFIV